MKAAIIRAHGGLDCVEVAEVDTPACRPGEVVIDVRAAALNHLDIWVRKGRPGLDLAFPHVLGSDAAGVVAEVGPGVSGVSVGDEVVINPGLWCGHCAYCLRGEQNQCPQYGITGMSRPGTFAQCTAVPAVAVQPKPAHLDLGEAAALPLAYLTAWTMLFDRGDFKAGETVLIHGIGGGVAIAALQLARLAGGSAIVTSSDPAKLERARELGAAHTLDYTADRGIGEAVRDLTGGRGVDVIIDSVGAATWATNFQAIRRGGRIVHCGVTSGAETTVNLSALYWNHVQVLGSTMGSPEGFRRLLRAVETARLHPVVDKYYPLDAARDAMARMEAGEQFGKIVLHPMA